MDEFDRVSWITDALFHAVNCLNVQIKQNVLRKLENLIHQETLEMKTDDIQEFEKKLNVKPRWFYLEFSDVSTFCDLPASCNCKFLFANENALIDGLIHYMNEQELYFIRCYEDENDMDVLFKPTKQYAKMFVDHDKFLKNFLKTLEDTDKYVRTETFDFYCPNTFKNGCNK